MNVIIIRTDKNISEEIIETAEKIIFSSFCRKRTDKINENKLIKEKNNAEKYPAFPDLKKLIMIKSETAE